MSLWTRLVGFRPIVTRLVLAVAIAMSLVLLVSGGFVFWRVEYALNRQLDQDLDAYREIVDKVVAHGSRPPRDTPGETYQVYDLHGRVVGGDATHRLATSQMVALAAAGQAQHDDVGHLFPPADHPYRVITARARGLAGPLVVATAISKRKHDEALRELMLQLTLAGLATLGAASLVGYGTARAALNPVERYRVAAARADTATRLPVPARKPDELTRLGTTFNALLDRLDAANDRERQFLADASHELRSPLSLMRTELEWVTMRPRTESENQTTFNSLKGQVERLIHVSNALLDLEELRSGHDGLSDHVDLNLVLDEVTQRFAGRFGAAERGLELVSEPDALVIGNAHWLDLALDNLISNALRYGQGTVQVVVRACGTMLEVAVADEGPGFPADFVEHAFDRFTRAESSRSSGGTGLGLSLVRAVAEAHGGAAKIRGARVSLTLPSARAAHRLAAPVPHSR